MKRRPPPPAVSALRVPGRHGLTLFEVVISLAIFLGGMAAIGQLVSSGAQGAVLAKLHSQGVIRAETTMGEVLCGYIALRNTSGTFPDNPAWTWAVSVSSARQTGLYLVEVTVTHKGQSQLSEVKSTLRRFVRDPAQEVLAYENALAEEQAKAANASSSTNSSSGNTSSGSSR